MSDINDLIAPENPENEKKSRTQEYIFLAASIIVIILAYLIYNKKIPKMYRWISEHYYVAGIAGFLGLIGERAAMTIIGIFLPLLLISLTVAFKLKPEKFNINEWFGVYSALVIFSGAYIFYIFQRWEKLKNNANGASAQVNLTDRIDPSLAARYRQQEAVKHAAEKPSLDKIAGVLRTKEPPKASAEPVNPNETAAERAEREARHIKEEFNRKTIKLSTTLLRIKNLTKTLDRDEIFSSVVEIIAKGLDGEVVQLLLNSEKDQVLRIVRAEGMQAKAAKEVFIPYSENSMITYFFKAEGGKVAEGGSLGVKECQIDPKLKGLVGQGSIKTVLAAPIIFDSKIFAIINVEKMKNPDYTRDDQNLIATCADIAGLVMKNAKLYAATVDDLVSVKKISEEQLRKNEELAGSLSRIVSPRVAELIMHNPSGLKLGGEKCIVTMFFSDIRGFTRMSEGMDPTDIVQQLNVYFTAMTDILMELDGTLDKYVGDELMALFGAPVGSPDDPIRAVLCGVKMLDKLRMLQEQWVAEGRPKIEIGIGINTGEVTAGYMGSEKQLSYTVIGDNVNLAARVMANAKPMQLLITRTTYEKVKDYFEIEPLEPIMVKGKSMAIDIFLVNSAKPDVDWATVIGSEISLASMGGEGQPAEDAPMKISSIASEISKDPLKQNFVADSGKRILECRECGIENNSQNKFCSHCGKPLM
ncbi:MAG: hypothetical protein HQM10_15885 [Candidatus Riflebacteria bacterium]|nr:hypothetical protein [Candidatus Riflebacteria bacterium]